GQNRISRICFLKIIYHTGPKLEMKNFAMLLLFCGLLLEAPSASRQTGCFLSSVRPVLETSEAYSV
ncbi:MAG: hypothetical protein DRG82_03545, partial [Deltaproteobacteria bacterium]